MKNWSWIPTLYFAEGLPYVVVTLVSLVFYKQMGLGNTEITFYTSWLYLPWVIKPLWSPFVELAQNKRRWVVVMQLLIGTSLGGIAFTIPTDNWFQSTLFFFWLAAFAATTHDIAADDLHMKAIPYHDRPLYIRIRLLCYNLAGIVAQGILVMIAGNLQVIYRNSISYSWSIAFYGLTGLFIGLWLWNHKQLPIDCEDHHNPNSNFHDIRYKTYSTIRSFFTDTPTTTLLFICLYRMPEGLFNKVSALFLIDAPHNGGLGLSPQEYGFVEGTIGIIALSLGGIIGSLVTERDGLRRWLCPMALSMLIPEVIYIFLSYILPNSLPLISLCVFFEQFGLGFGTTTLLLFLIYHNRDKHKNTYYTIANSLMVLSLMIPSFVAGYLQELLDYRIFFVIALLVSVLILAITNGFANRKIRKVGA